MTYGFYSLTEEASVVPASGDASVTPSPVFSWPASCRDGFVSVDSASFSLRLSTEDNRLQKDVPWQEILRLPATTEVQKLHSKSGWMMQGFWSTLTFQRLMTKMPGTEPYNWVELISLNGQRVVLPKSRLNNYRLIFKCDDKFLTPMYGGPLWVHCFEHYVEYGIPQIAEIRFLTAERPSYHPSQELGFPQTAMRVQTGNYYMIHKEQIKHFRY